AEDGIRGPLVTGVQTCALPISNSFFLAGFLLEVGRTTPYTLACIPERHCYGPIHPYRRHGQFGRPDFRCAPDAVGSVVVTSLCKIGRASCREIVTVAGVVAKVR